MKFKQHLSESRGRKSFEEFDLWVDLDRYGVVIQNFGRGLQKAWPFSERKAKIMPMREAERMAASMKEAGIHAKSLQDAPDYINMHDTNARNAFNQIRSALYDIQYAEDDDY